MTMSSDEDVDLLENQPQRKKLFRHKRQAWISTQVKQDDAIEQFRQAQYRDTESVERAKTNNAFMQRRFSHESQLLSLQRRTVERELTKAQTMFLTNSLRHQQARRIKHEDTLASFTPERRSLSYDCIPTTLNQKTDYDRLKRRNSSSNWVLTRPEFRQRSLTVSIPKRTTAPLFRPRANTIDAVCNLENINNSKTRRTNSLSSQSSESSNENWSEECTKTELHDLNESLSTSKDTNKSLKKLSASDIQQKDVHMSQAMKICVQNHPGKSKASLCKDDGQHRQARSYSFSSMPELQSKAKKANYHFKFMKTLVSQLPPQLYDEATSTSRLLKRQRLSRMLSRSHDDVRAVSDPLKDDRFVQLERALCRP